MLVPFFLLHAPPPESETTNQKQTKMDKYTPQAFYISLLLLALTVFLYYAWRTIKSPPPSGMPPSPPLRLPVIGHLHLLTQMPHHTFAHLANQLGPIIYLQLGQVPTIVISSARLAQLVLKTYDHIFANRPQPISAQYLSFGCSDVTFSTYGPYWRQARKICVTELLSPKRVNSFKLVREEEVNRLVNAVSAQSGTDVDMSKLFFSLANDILCRVAFRERFIEGDGVEAEQKSELVKVLTETQALLGGFCVGDFFPGSEWVNSVTGYKRRMMKNLEDLRAVCEVIIREHWLKKEGKSGNDSEDFVDVLLRIQQKDDLEVPITDDNLKALVLDMFVAGTDTSSATLEWTMTELATHPRVLRIAQEEVRKVASSRGRVDEADLQHLNYIKAVIKETMRLHPPVPLLVPRESMEDCILEGYKIPAKTRVLINAYAMGRDPKLWENPLEYNPERFVENEIDFRDQEFRFLPFGGGRRGCPGYAFGLATVELALAALLYHFDWALPNGVGPDDVDLTEIFGLAIRKKSALILEPKARKDSMYTGHDIQ